MKFLIRLLIVILKMLQSIPYETVIQTLDRKLLPKEKSKPTRYPQKIQISFKHGAVFLNEVKIISGKSAIANKIFETLFDQFIRDKKSGLETRNHIFVAVKKLAKILEDNGFVIADIEKQVRWPLNKIRRFVKSVPELCVLLENEEIIENQRCSGIDSKNHGYRLNANLVFV
jgi:hypothetical protein